MATAEVETKAAALDEAGGAAAVADEATPAAAAKPLPNGADEGAAKAEEAEADGEAAGEEAAGAEPAAAAAPEAEAEAEAEPVAPAPEANGGSGGGATAEEEPAKPADDEQPPAEVEAGGLVAAEAAGAVAAAAAAAQRQAEPEADGLARRSSSGAPTAAPPPLLPPRGPTRATALGMAKGMASINPDAEVVRASDLIDEVRASPVRVADLSKQLESGAAAGNGGSSDSSGAREGPSLGSRSASGVALTQHDLVNTANVALVLQAGEFKLRPGIDVVPYEELKELRLEDGLDVSRKEEYLSDAEFETVFGIEKEEFRNMPVWKRISLKKSKGLF